MTTFTVGLLLLGTSCCFTWGYQTDALKLHNQFRAIHRSPALKMDATLNTNALRCAKYYAVKKAIDHSCPLKNGAGENLFWAKGSKGMPTEVEAVKRATTAWYNEIKKYNFGKPAFSKVTGHFTQVVWKATTKFGIGVHRDMETKRTYVCALYSPHGNQNGKFPANVLRP